ncbi:MULTISPECIES: endolytic transglycosylase MltG [Bacillus]|uniref:endolytic transglycosylase MltG n=1 Tax=Bacillus TaxID=1386 RepID=UPI000D1FDD70|nr:MULTISPECIES: endolytic transglycosylase MltG [Bacillus]AVX16621.1 endolytic transglycosylase MltG [Bacillus sp. ZY-1-1]MDF3254668.1 endolytic transglycosylase MltG [Bacillus velezensis]MDF3268103.1 endolytic transglycosylase MltG [Bacillus velezensis]
MNINQTKNSFPRKNKKTTIILSSVIALLIIICGAFFYGKSLLSPVDKGSKTAVNINIPSGSSVSAIAEILEDQHVIKSKKAFQLYVKYKGASGFQAGFYHLNKGMDADAIIKKLTAGSTGYAFQISVPEGKQLTQIADAIAKETSYSKEEIMAKLDDKTFIGKLKKQFPDTITDALSNKKLKHPLEGYLYPATYPFNDPDASLDTILTAMVQETNTRIETYKSELEKKKLSVHDALTMASLIEEEATAKADRHKIASVFYNRLAEKMPLQTDPTVLYAAGKHKSRVYYKDLKIDSPFNTYKHKGLPPGPIANAGDSSWEAALRPDKTDYLYFLAKPNGEVVFTKTLKDHNKAKEKYISKKDSE